MFSQVDGGKDPISPSNRFPKKVFVMSYGFHPWNTSAIYTYLSNCIMSTKRKFYLTCCCLETDIYYRCLYTLSKRCFAATTAPNCCLDLMKETVAIYSYLICLLQSLYAMTTFFCIKNQKAIYSYLIRLVQAYMQFY